MRTIIHEKRKNNILIATIITVFGFILNILLFLTVRSLNVHLTMKVILFIALLFYVLFILPGLLLKLQDFIYKQLCKNIDIIEEKLSSDYKPIFLNTNCLKVSAIPLHMQRKYFARLEYNGEITLKVQTEYSDEVFEEQISDYSWFLSMFRFNE